MANSINFTGTGSSLFVDSTSRYNNSFVIIYGDKRRLTFTTYKRTPLPSSPSDRFTMITAATEFRPDLISFAEYGIPHFWWRIMEFNNIFDIAEFTKGITIRLPSTLL